MFYLFILESIGTSELILIGLVALIVFGPRKLPELAKMLGKAMNEFRRSTDDFKKTWEQEVNFENDEVDNKSKINSNLISETSIPFDNSVQENKISMKNEIIAPEIKELNGSDLPESFSKDITSINPKTKINQTNKRDWL